MDLLLTCPSKVFLSGEYLALSGESCFVLGLEPYFTLKARTAPLEKPHQIKGLSEKSPLSAWLQKRPLKYDLEFLDPHEGRGGFGASSAQFLLSYILSEQDLVLKSGLQLQVSATEMLKTYHSVNGAHQGLLPSGADVLAQWKGGLTFWNRQRGQLERRAWPFTDISFLVVPTGHKVTTHEHLKTLNAIDTSSGVPLHKEIEEALFARDSIRFVPAMKKWALWLEASGFVAMHTQKLLESLRKDQRVLMAKGCGALGADVVLILVANHDRDSFEKDWSSLGVFQGPEKLATGFECKIL